MNTCILMAEVISNPELRKTPDDVDVANMMIEFPGLRDEEPTARMRVVGWRNLGVEMSEKYRMGDRVIIEGRLSMNLIEMNGYKEKRAELVASRIYPIGEASNQSVAQPQPAAMASNVVDLQPASPQPEAMPTPGYSTVTPGVMDNTADETYEGNPDDIPF